MQPNLILPSFLAGPRPRLCVLILLALSACADAEGDSELGSSPLAAGADAGSAPSFDSALPSNPVATSGSTSPSGAGSSSGSSSSSSGSSGSTPSSAPAVIRDSGGGLSASDAGAPVDLDGILGGLFGDDDAGPRLSSGDGGAGEWKLQPESAEECPEEPPPIPLIGGPCLGVYYSCDWKNASGETYSCICDWIHWLCI